MCWRWLWVGGVYVDGSCVGIGERVRSRRAIIAIAVGYFTFITPPIRIVLVTAMVECNMNCCIF